jgi:hypothetical protein
VPATRGARHTSARRFTFDVPQALVVVVSEAGQVTLFSGGAVAAHISASSAEAESTTSPADAPPSSEVRCERCATWVLVERRAEGTGGPPACPTCEAPLPLDEPARVLGVPVASPTDDESG